MRQLAFAIAALLVSVSMAPARSAEPLKLLFLGDSGHHRPAARFEQLQPVMKERGIELTYTDRMEDVNPENLGKYAGLVIYANTTRISPEQEQALLDYVAGGKGLIPLHCASYCFLNSPKYIELVGAQFQRHGTGTFRTALAETDHPIMKGFGGFESWDETYVHTKHNEKDRTVLEYRDERGNKEPWTWVRTHGKGRVFYTAWGHDQRTWGNAGFQNLVERGIRWAVGADPGVVPAFAATAQVQANSAARNATEGVPYSADYAPEMTAKRTDVKPFEYTPAKVAYYPPGRRTAGDGEWNKMQLPLDDVAESMKHMVTPVGFEVKLFVAEPQLEGKPIFMTWDERGRLWVCETYDYPNELQPSGQGRDSIRICEDSDGDGKADKFTLFADKLSIPTAVAFYRGGALVQAGGETLYLKDTNGDDKADLRKTLITGWGMRDTHGEVSNFRYGLDNWYWAMQGYNNSSPVLTDGRQVQGFRQGFFRFKVEGDGEQVAVTDLEFLRSTNNNTWGLGHSEEGLVFGSTANGNPSEFLPIPNRYYEAVRGWSSSVLNGIADSNRFYPVTENVRQVDFHGGFTAAAGHALYTARNYPKEYWNRTAFVTEPTGHLIATFVLRREGAGYRSRNAWNLVASDDEWTAPIQAEVGPDGNVWFIDWYNYIVQHNPTPAGFRTGRGAAYETDLRDKKHGRIYRLLYVGRASGRPDVDFSRAGETPAPQLVAALKSDVMYTRLQAQRLLVERGNKDVVPALVELAKDQTVDAIGLNTAAIHALGTLAGLGAIEGDALAAAVSGLKHPSAGVRRNAIQVLPSNADSLAALLSSGVLNDADVQVRLAALLALADLPAAESSAAAAIAALADPAVQQDRRLLDAATAAAAKSGAAALLAAMKSTNTALLDPAATERLTIVADHVARSGLESPVPLLTAMQSAPPDLSGAILAGLARGWPRDRQLATSGELEFLLQQLFVKLAPAGKSQLVSLATRWGSQGLQEQIAKLAAGFLADASNNELGDVARIAAAVRYVEIHRSSSESGKLLELINPRTSPELARGLVEALGRSDSALVGSALVEALPKLTPAVRPAALSALLGKSTWTLALLTAIEEGKVQLADLSLDQKQALASHPDRRLAGRARRLLEAGGSLPNPDRQKVLDELLPLTKVAADAAAGKLVYKNQCAKCHTHSGEGTKIGPDLTGMAVHPKHELLVHLIDPSRSVEGNYRVYAVLTADGIVINGLLASETKTSIELIDSEAKKHVVLREDIQNLQASSKSLMPDGFEKQVKPEELANLLEFLTQRGQYVPLPLDKVATVVTTKGMFYDENAQGERLVFSDWGPKTFEGVPFTLIDPKVNTVPNAIMLRGPEGRIPPTMPRSVSIPCAIPAKAIHLLSGVSGWGYPYGQQKSTSLIVRLHYADGQTEDHNLINGEHFADYIRRVDVPQSKFAFDLRGKQLRYLSVLPQRAESLAKIELVKGDDRTAPVVMAVTVETR